jgi:phosphoribosyl-AMP cyclohydrolase
MINLNELTHAIVWNDQGLVPVIVQEDSTGDVLMFAWMNHVALQETLSTGKAVYFSRSRGRLWRKGEESGHWQLLKSLHLDCDGDALLMRVEQQGHQPPIACHTGRHSCFYKKFSASNNQWEEASPVLKAPSLIYATPA